MYPDIPDKFNIIQIHKPICIIHHQGFGMLLFHGMLFFPEFYKAAHLSLKAFTVMFNGFLRHHSAQVTPARRVSYHACASANQCNRLISCHLQTLHQAKRHKMPHMQTVRSGVKTNVEGCPAVVD